MTDPGDAGDPAECERLADWLRARIEDGTIAPGEPAPSITVLAAGSNWARQTCARALQRLAGEGLLTRYPGLGYYVNGATRRRT
jgi:GntR family transcriptional regulator